MGIKGKTDRLAKVFPANTITIDLWGLAYYRPFEYKMATHNDVFSISGNIIKNEKVGLYLVSTMRYLRNIFNFNKKGTWTRIKEYGIKLPVDDNGDIDYEFMENLTAAMMKLCIAKLKEKMKREHETYKKAVAGA